MIRATSYPTDTERASLKRAGWIAQTVAGRTFWFRGNHQAVFDAGKWQVWKGNDLQQKTPDLPNWAKQARM